MMLLLLNNAGVCPLTAALLHLSHTLCTSVQIWRKTAQSISNKRRCISLSLDVPLNLTIITTQLPKTEEGLLVSVNKSFNALI